MSNNTAYEMITERVIEQLDAGAAPWQMPWTARDNAPRNITGRRYHGINVFLLLVAGYSSPYWLTWNQIKARGGMVRKGEHGTVIVFWKQLRVKDDTDGAELGATKTIPLLRYFRVWNIEQSTVEAPDAGAVDEEFAEMLDAEQIIKGYLAREDAPEFVEGGAAAHYSPVFDRVTVPARADFHTADAFYSTSFHECGHSTGHRSRLARPGVAEFDHFGSDRYGREELVAEMTAAFLSAEAGITATFDNSAAYLASWIKTLREDVRAVVVAAGAAQRAADYILGRETSTGSDD